MQLLIEISLSQALFDPLLSCVFIAESQLSRLFGIMFQLHLSHNS